MCRKWCPLQVASEVKTDLNFSSQKNSKITNFVPLCRSVKELLRKTEMFCGYYHFWTEVSLGKLKYFYPKNLHFCCVSTINWRPACICIYHIL